MNDAQERLGCPSCGNEDSLIIEQSVHESVIFWSDGTYECVDTVDYGPVMFLYCHNCNWEMTEGLKDLSTSFVAAHAELIKAELIKEMKSV